MKALIFGISGQDGTYLSQLLLNKGYKVFGTSRDSMANHFYNLKKINIKNDIEIATVNLTNFISVLKHIDIIRPDEIYNLAGQTSVALSFKYPIETMKSIVNATLNILEAIRKLNPSIRFYNASSSDCFGNTGEHSANEETAFKPLSPYGAAKTEAHLLVKKYRERYKLHASNGILFNHESPIRSHHFVTQKIAHTAARIRAGYKERLKLGNLSISRDWGWAPDYVEAMWRIVRQPNANEFVIATGKTISLEEFVEKVFIFFNLNWKNHVDVDNSLFRPSDIKISKGDPSKAKKILGWIAKNKVDEVINQLCMSAKEIYINKKIQ
jgi:GDPmannose 4,6-dehydratase